MTLYQVSSLCTEMLPCRQRREEGGLDGTLPLAVSRASGTLHHVPASPFTFEREDSGALRVGELYRETVEALA